MDDYVSSYFLLYLNCMNKSSEEDGQGFFDRYLHLYSLKYIFKLATLDSTSRPEGIL